MQCRDRISRNGRRLTYQGFIEQGTKKIARPEKGAKVLDTTTRADYKVTNGVVDKHKIRPCVCGNQQVEGVHYKSGGLYTVTPDSSYVSF
jgi:hypothetical protein